MVESKTDTGLQDASTRDSGGLRLSLACPKCGTAGWTDLSKLRRGLKCPTCGCQFVVASNGRMLKQDQLRQIRYSCPRCRQTGTVSAQLHVRKAFCSGCRLTLVAGPDQQLYGEQEAQAMHRSAHAAAGQRRLRDRLKRSLTRADGELHRRNVALLAMAMIVFVTLGWSSLMWLSDDSVETRARAFTHICLTGDWDAAEAYLPDDAVQRAEFSRWRVRHFSSLLDNIRPAGDAVHIDAVDVEAQPSYIELRVTMKSPFMGTRTHEQRWLPAGDQWWFDVQGTLAKTDGRPGRTPTMAARRR